jgi:hypothetical protein
LDNGSVPIAVEIENPAMGRHFLPNTGPAQVLGYLGLDHGIKAFRRRIAVNP